MCNAPTPTKRSNGTFTRWSTWWNLYGLPVLLVVVAIAFWSCESVASSGELPRNALFLGPCAGSALSIVLWHLQALMSLAQEVLTLRIMGIPESLVSPVGAMIQLAGQPDPGDWACCGGSTARRFAIGWYAFLSVVAVWSFTGCAITMSPLTRRPGPIK